MRFEPLFGSEMSLPKPSMDRVNDWGGGVGREKN